MSKASKLIEQVVHESLTALCMGPNECHLVIGHGDNFKCYNPDVVKDAQQLREHPEMKATLAELAKAKRLK